ncbi:hypothetical protein MKEN_00567000 [Mycena kentingensis (nom. inval.)]|nr:hypothetical protein MKEN_00567000 [Mycena kentingensis (nom. inval.)]
MLHAYALYLAAALLGIPLVSAAEMLRNVGIHQLDAPVGDSVTSSADKVPATLFFRGIDLDVAVPSRTINLAALKSITRDDATSSPIPNSVSSPSPPQHHPHLPRIDVLANAGDSPSNTASDTPTASAPNASSDTAGVQHRTTVVIIGSVATLATLLLLGLAIFWYTRRSQYAKKREWSKKYALERAPPAIRRGLRGPGDGFAVQDYDYPGPPSEHASGQAQSPTRTPTSTGYNSAFPMLMDVKPPQPPPEPYEYGSGYGLGRRGPIRDPVDAYEYRQKQALADGAKPNDDRSPSTGVFSEPQRVPDTFPSTLCALLLPNHVPPHASDPFATPVPSAPPSPKTPLPPLSPPVSKRDSVVSSSIEMGRGHARTGTSGSTPTTAGMPSLVGIHPFSVGASEEDEAPQTSSSSSSSRARSTQRGLAPALSEKAALAALQRSRDGAAEQLRGPESPAFSEKAAIAALRRAHGDPDAYEQPQPKPQPQLDSPALSEKAALAVLQRSRDEALEQQQQQASSSSSSAYPPAAIRAAPAYGEKDALRAFEATRPVLPTQEERDARALAVMSVVSVGTVAPPVYEP